MLSPPPRLLMFAHFDSCKEGPSIALRTSLAVAQVLEHAVNEYLAPSNSTTKSHRQFICLCA